MSETSSGVPSGLNAESGDSEISLTWNEVADATGYDVKRSWLDGGPYTTIATVETRSYIDTGLINGRTYFYVVSAILNGDEGPDSNQLSAIPEILVSGASLLHPGIDRFPKDDLSGENGSIRLVVRLSDDGNIEIGAVGRVGSELAIETSVDLIHWEHVDGIRPGAESVKLGRTKDKQHFYRAVRVP